MNRYVVSLLLLGLTLESAARAATMTLPVDVRCTVSFGNDQVDYGTVSRWQLQDAQTGPHEVTFGKRTLMLSVICPYSQTIRLRLYGERNASGDLRYGDRGRLILRLSDAQLDGKNVQLVSSRPDGVVEGSTHDSLWLQPGQVFAPGIDGKALTARIEIEPILPETEARVGSLRSSESRFRIELKE
ncbi:fimbrial protein [Pseudomonas sp. dw_358]|uniref:fimbrial protein n=1 Tax=Pseudomonas sp. dw_358 TaxID=2720083 RepID=UPI001BD5B923|nr:fimbrial protein [Pseudomonas sp. dw_358]